jgi:hypothetical protein
MLGLALAYSMIEAVRRPVTVQGIEEVGMSWILEDNSNMRHILESFGAQPCKRHRTDQ